MGDQKLEFAKVPDNLRCTQQLIVAKVCNKNKVESVWKKRLISFNKTECQEVRYCTSANRATLFCNNPPTFIQQL